jgi:outer membrane protein
VKNLSLVLNVILLVAVGVLFYLHFKSRSGEYGKATSGSDTLATAGLPIAYVNYDSITAKYSLFSKIKSDLEAKSKKLEGEYTARVNSFQNEVNAYQKSQGNMTVNEIKLTEEKLMMKEQQLMQYKEQLNNQLMQDQMKQMEDIMGRINTFMKKYGQDKKYSLVLWHQKGGPILFANDSLEITDEIVAGLNQEYNNANSKVSQ